jgi:heme-degrading monooxygenase HmoA
VDVDALLRAWAEDALWIKKQSGFISTQLHRAVGDSYLFVNYAVWEAVKHFRWAFTHPDFRNAIAGRRLHPGQLQYPRKRISHGSSY